MPFPNMTWRRSDSLTTPAPTAISPAPPGSAGGISGPRRPTTGSSVGEPGGGGGGRGPLHPNRSWVNPNLRGPHGKPLTSSGSPFSTPSQPRTSSSQQTPPITPHRAPRQSTGASGKPPPGGGGQQLFRTPSSLPGCRGGGPNIEWTPAPSSGRKRRSPTSRKGPLPYTEVISPNPYAPLGTTPIRDQGASATGTSLPKSTPRRAGIRSQPPAVHSPPHSQRTKPRSQLAAPTPPVALQYPTSPSSSSQARSPSSSSRAAVLRTPNRQPRIDTRRANQRSDSPPQEPPQERQHSSDGTGTRHTPSQAPALVTPFLLVRGAPFRARARDVLRDLRDVFGLPIPAGTEAYRGPRSQVVLHLPSPSTATQLFESQDRWLDVSRWYSLHPFDPRSPDLSSSERRAWIREMRRVTGTDHVFQRV